MSYNRYVLLKRFLHLAPNNTMFPRGEPGHDPWHKIRPMLDHLNGKFKKHYVSTVNVSIDESMIGMKNRHIYIQYLPNKRHCRFGIKKFEVCEAHTGYVFHIELYSGKEFPIHSEDGQGSAVVMHLMEQAQLLNKGYHLQTDNWYTKCKLATDLLQKDTSLTGTVRANSKGLPKLLTRPGKMKPQTTKYAKKGNLLCCAYMDKKSQRKPVLSLSTASPSVDLTSEVRGTAKLRPYMAQTYNAGMGGVDLMDRKIYQIAAERPCNKYWMKIFFNLVDIAVRNSYEIYQQTDLPKLSCQDFVSRVVEGLCTPTPPPVATPLCFSMLHVSALLDGKKERDCVVCSDRAAGIRRRSRHWCPGCGVGVHEKCFDGLEHCNRVGGRKRPASP